MANSFKQLSNLIDLMIPEVKKIFIQVMQGIADEAFIDEMIKAIENNDPTALFKATGFTPAALTPILDAIDNVYQTAGETTADGFPARIRTPTGSVSFRFDIRNPAAEKDLADTSGQLITQLTEDARTNVRNLLSRGMIAGDNPKTTALNIVGRIDPVTKARTGGILGLTTNQEGWVANGTRYLEQLDPTYFDLGLRDKRFDSIVQDAIDTETPLSDDIISKLMTAYKNNALIYRGETIARTEVVQSVNKAEYTAHAIAITEGTIDASTVTRHWDDVGDKKTRHTHVALNLLYGDDTAGVGMNEPFISPSGAQMMYPGDRSLGASTKEIINCRCRQKIEVDWTAGVD